MLFRKSKMLALIFILAMALTSCHIVPRCLEYTWTFYIMFITSIIAINIEKRGDKGLNLLFFITGILTCFLDFLSTELLTFVIPILFVLIIRHKENRVSSFKAGITFLIKSSILWGLGYTGMWLAKWGISSVILGINAMDFVTEKVLNRINGLQGVESYEFMYKGAITNNWDSLYIVRMLKNKENVGLILGIIGIIILILMDWKHIKKMWFQILLLIIATMPYIRYLILANHSFRHAMFTYRLQIITIIAVLWAIYWGIKRENGKITQLLNKRKNKN